MQDAQASDTESRALALTSGASLQRASNRLRRRIVWLAGLAVAGGLGAAPAVHIAPWLYLSLWLSLAVMGCVIGLAVVATRAVADAYGIIAVLEQQVQSAVIEVLSVRREMARACDANTAYMRKVAHELRSPLAASVSSLQVLREGLVGEVGGRQKEMVSRAERRCRQLLKTVDDLLILSRSQSASPATQVREPVSVVHVIENLASLLESRAEAANVRLVLDLDHGVPTIGANLENVTQVLTNLMANAVKYTPPGGSVMVRVDGKDGFIEVIVADTGIGIEAGDLPRIFDEFYRARNARGFAEVGTGLGLAIARTVTESLGGTLNVASEPGRGTVFALRLPTGPPPVP